MMIMIHNGKKRGEYMSLVPSTYHLQNYYKILKTLLILDLIILGVEMKEEGYLKKFTPGNFNFTFIVSSGKFSEADMNLAKHLIYNNKARLYYTRGCIFFTIVSKIFK